MLVSPPALGADAVARAGPATVVDSGVVFPPLPAGEATLTAADFVQRAAWDTDRSLDGRAVVLTGFAVRRGDAVHLARLTIFCCAADVRVNRVRLVGDVVAVGALVADTWLRVRGTVVPASAGPDTQYVPALTLTAVEEVPVPPDPRVLTGRPEPGPRAAPGRIGAWNLPRVHRCRRAPGTARLVPRQRARTSIEQVTGMGTARRLPPTAAPRWPSPRCWCPSRWPP
jgi:hypothetical protein